MITLELVNLPVEDESLRRWAGPDLTIRRQAGPTGHRALDPLVTIALIGAGATSYAATTKLLSDLLAPLLADFLERRKKRLEEQLRPVIPAPIRLEIRLQKELVVSDGRSLADGEQARKWLVGLETGQASLPLGDDTTLRLELVE